jgi:hypothetical protein
MGRGAQQQGISQRVTAHCPQCREAVEVSDAEVMVYCVRCRKWCRPSAEEARPAAPPHPPSQPKLRIRRDNRCH